MSLAPAKSRGAFLKARLAVNGIQCAARSLGTLTAGRAGLLSSILGLTGRTRRISVTVSASRSGGNGQLPTFEADQPGKFTAFPCPGRDAISAFTRVFDALWRSSAKRCFAEPGP